MIAVLDEQLLYANALVRLENAPERNTDAAVASAWRTTNGIDMKICAALVWSERGSCGGRVQKNYQAKKSAIERVLWT